MYFDWFTSCSKVFTHFREQEKSSLAYDIICSSNALLETLENSDSSNEINTIEMVIPNLNEESLDLYVNYTRKNGEKYDLAIPQSTTSYTAYLLNSIQTWTDTENTKDYLKKEDFRYASRKLLLILKKYMLYYPKQWQKTANDYRQLLTITKPLTSDDKELCDLFIQYNEKLHGPRTPNTDHFYYQIISK